MRNTLKIIMHLNIYCLITALGLYPKLIYASPIQNQTTLHQFSTFDAFISGLYDGLWSYQEILKYGNFGLASPDKVDGETIILNRKVYEAKSDGKTQNVSLHKKTPFAWLVKFKAEKQLVLSGLTKTKFEHYLSQHLLQKNQIYAIKIRGIFSNLTTRANPQIEKPYKPLAQEIQKQKVFHLSESNGQMIGFYFPYNLKGINLPGYHFHYLSSDPNAGGHVLNYELKNVVIELMPVHNFNLHIPTTEKYNSINFTLDRSNELANIE